MIPKLQQGLTSLALRKTEEGRANADRAIESWRRALAAVQEARKSAECRISLTAEQVQGIEITAVKVKRAPYIVAVDLARHAVAMRDSVLETASETLRKEIKQREALEFVAKQDLDSAARERENRYSVAAGEYFSTVEKIERDTRNLLWSFDRLIYKDDGDPRGYWFLLALVSWIASVIFIVSIDSLSFGAKFALSAGMVIVCLYAMFGMVPSILSYPWRAYAKSRKSSRVAIADGVRKRAEQQADGELEIATVEVEERRKDSEAFRNKADRALKYLKTCE